MWKSGRDAPGNSGKGRIFLAKTNWQQLLDSGCPVFYFYSQQEYLVQRQASQLLELLSREDPEVTRLDGPTPDLEEIIASAGTISFFGTRRVVYIPGLMPGSYSDKDLKEFCEVLSQAENAVFLLTSVFADKKAASGKRVNTLISHCRKIGFAQELALPTQRDLVRMLQQQAQELGASLGEPVARELIERCGQDPYLLENEVAKLAALADYGAITSAMVEEAAVQNLEANVFSLMQLIAARNAKGACQLVHKLLLLRQEPVTIAAALASGYLDCYRVRCGGALGKSYQEVHRDFHYTGGDFRLRKAMENSRKFTKPQLARSLGILQQLDEGLKRSPVDPRIQLETGVCRLAGVVTR